MGPSGSIRLNPFVTTTFSSRGSMQDLGHLTGLESGLNVSR